MSNKHDNDAGTHNEQPQPGGGGSRIDFFGGSLTSESTTLSIFDSSMGGSYYISFAANTPAGGTGTIKLAVSHLVGSASMGFRMYIPTNHAEHWYLFHELENLPAGHATQVWSNNPVL